jgi:pimeloyl-ACP methyl ester carboxylesterase
MSSWTSRAHGAIVHRSRSNNARRMFVVAVSAASLLAVGVPVVIAGAPRLAASTRVPRSLLDQHLRWSVCYPGQGVPQLRCARVTVPLDWRHPRGHTITIAVSRIKAADPGRRQGVLFTNPGGPGAEGLDLPLFIPQTDPSIAAAFDLIGIDQRGVGTAHPTLHCANQSVLTRLYNLDGRNSSRRNQARFKRLDERYARQCSSAPLTPYIHDSQTVRDFDLVRRLLHEKKINYLGFSGGTQLGAWYASAFPAHVGRFVLDGNIDWTSLTYKSFNRQARGFQNSFEHFLEPWIAKYHFPYHLGHTAHAVDATYEHRRAALARKPLTLTNGTKLTAAGFDSGIISALYVTSDYPDIAAAMHVLEHYSTATMHRRRLVTEMFSSSTEGQDPFWAIVCQDDRSQTYRQLVAETNRFRRHYPLIGANWNANPCPFFNLPVTGSPVRGAKLPRLLMLDNDNDPATPLRNARIARSRTPKARLVTVRNESEHTIYGYGDRCADGYANRWLLRGVLPRHDTSCPGVPLPSPKSIAREKSRAALPGRLPAELWVRQFVAQHGQPTMR